MPITVTPTLGRDSRPPPAHPPTICTPCTGATQLDACRVSLGSLSCSACLAGGLLGGALWRILC